MNSGQLQSLSREWIKAKEEERQATENRRGIEDQMAALIGITETMDGTKTVALADYKVKVTCRISKHINSDMLQELAAEAGISQHLGSLFRWKPEVNAKEWKNADESITRALAGAITAKPGRPSFSITEEI